RARGAWRSPADPAPQTSRSGASQVNTRARLRESAQSSLNSIGVRRVSTPTASHHSGREVDEEAVPSHYTILVRDGREHDDRRGAPFPQLPTHLWTARVDAVHLNDHRIGYAQRCTHQSVLRRSDRIDTKARPAQDGPQQADACQLVVTHANGCRAG